MNLDFLRDPFVLTAVGGFVIGFGTNAAKHWLRARARRRTAQREVEYEYAKQTPGLDDDVRTEIALRIAKGDEQALEAFIEKADNGMLAGLLKQVLTGRR